MCEAKVDRGMFAAAWLVPRFLQRLPKIYSFASSTGMRNRELGPGLDRQYLCQASCLKLNYATPCSTTLNTSLTFGTLGGLEHRMHITPAECVSPSGSLLSRMCCGSKGQDWSRSAWRQLSILNPEALMVHLVKFLVRGAFITQGRSCTVLYR